MTTRIATPATIETAPVAAQPLLQGVKAKLGSAPNLFRVVANRQGGSTDAKAAAAVAFAVKVVEARNAA